VTVLITGGAGFIGSALVRHLIEASSHAIVNVDRLTYAANPASLADLADHPRYRLEQVDITDAAAVTRCFAEHRPTTVLHLAAESHVDRSIDRPAEFIRTNVVGSYTMLEAATRYCEGLSAGERTRFRFVHVSTDEVFGSLGDSGAFTLDSPYRPASPYSATKASADHLARAWHSTFGLPVLVTNCSNNYGPRQFPEKLIPLTILNALEGRPVAVYGTGKNVRDWLHVEDHVAGLVAAMERGTPGETYLFGGGAERKNLEVVRAICQLVDRLAGPLPSRVARTSLIQFVADRPGHDFRYAIDPSHARQALAWAPSRTFEEGLTQTVEWYLTHRDWWEPARRAQHQGQRLGLGAGA